MARWEDLEREAPELAAHGRRLLYQFGPSGPGLGFLATTRADGGPRVHPVCPALHDGQLYVFVVGNSPKRYDLERDRRYALHAFPGRTDDESFYCTGPAAVVRDSALRTDLASAAAHDVRPDEMLFHLLLGRVLYTTWVNPRQPNTHAVYTRWRAPVAPSAA